MLNLHLLECTLKGYDHISDLLLAKYWVITGCKYNNCKRLQSITIPANVTSIGNYAFDGCSKLQYIYSKAIQPPKLENAWVFESSIITTIYVPTESVDAYKAAANWQKYSDKIVGYDFE